MAFKQHLRLLVLPKMLLSIILIASTSVASAQFQDDFSDLDFTARWQGDTEKFFVNELAQLQLNDTTSSSPAQLFTPINILNSTTWNFWVRMEFAPSTSNFSRIILFADDTGFSTAFNGYWLKIGGISGADDAIELYRQDGNSSTLLLTGTTGAVGAAPVVARIQVVRDQEGFWTINADYEGTNNLVEEGTTFDDTYSSGNFFGIECQYTSTRRDRFFFDDFQVDTETDRTIPTLLVAEAVDATTVQLTFDEPIQLNSNTNDFILEPSVAVGSVALTTSNQLTLSLNEPLTNLENYTITVQNIADIAGNLLQNTTANFTFIQIDEATSYDLLINEIMADPSPAIGLPEIEYIELYNRSDKVLNLDGFLLTDPSKEIELPNYSLLPGQYVALYEGAENLLGNNSLGLSDFLSLGNTGDNLTLISPTGEVIHAVQYSIDWYKDSSKDDGGWSLELINPEQPCNTTSSNWQASNNGNGGTPGNQNSVLNEIPDETFEGLLRVLPLDDRTVRLFFSEAVDINIANDITNYNIAGLNLITAIAEPPLFNTVLLEFDTAIPPNEVYTINLDGQISDCLGRAVENGRTAEFAIPDQAEALDIIVNEILFNPATGGSDFVELYNRSQKILNLSDLVIATRSAGSLSDVQVIETGYLIFPNQYVVLTESVEDIRFRYQVQQPTALIEANLPSLPDKAGTVVIYRTGALSEVVLDEFEYSNDFHNALLDDENGVSLERINPDAPTQDENNWHSAAASAGFATPTAQNSQFLQTINSSDAFSLTAPTISPDDDGFQDFLQINYDLDQAGFTANASIFDANGRLVKELLRGEILATTGNIKWDGVTDDNTKARLGIYILYIEYFTPEGRTEMYKQEFVVAGRLN